MSLKAPKTTLPRIDLGRSAYDYLAIDEQDVDDVAALADDRGGFWLASSVFIESLRDKTAAELSFKQTQWALDIVDKLADLRRRGKL